MMTDPIADMLTRLRNGQQANKKMVDIPFSKVKQNILDVLVTEGYLRGATTSTSAEGHPILVAELKYYQGKPVMAEMKRFSKPGLRQYSAAEDIPKVKNGLGVTIMSTSKGVMTDTKAREEHVGGEVLCQIF